MMCIRETIVCMIVVSINYVYGTYHVSQKKTDFYTAMHDCDKRGLKLLDGQPLGHDLSVLMTREKLDAVWIAITRKEVFWQWTDEEPYDGFNAEASDHQCALLKFNGELVSSTCIAQQAGFVCQISDHLSCPPKFTCLTMNGTKLFIDCSSNDWFASRYRCRRYQGDLLHLRHPSVTSKVAQFMEHQTKCQQVFIGLYKEKWLHVEPHSDGYIIYQTHWDTGQPAYAFAKNCVELLLNAKGEILWRTQSCTHRNRFICSDGKAVQPTKEATVKPSAAPMQKKGKEDTLPNTQHQWLFLLFLVPAVVIGGLFFCLFWFLYHWRYKKTRPGKIIETEQEAMESLPLSKEKDVEMSDSLMSVVNKLGVLSREEVSHKPISMPIRILLLGGKIGNCEIGHIAQLWPQVEDKTNSRASLDDCVEARLLIQTYQVISRKKAEYIDDISIKFASVYENNQNPAPCQKISDILSSIMATFEKDKVGCHILYYPHGKWMNDSSITRFLQKLKSKCITVTNKSSANAICVLNSNEIKMNPSNAGADFEAAPQLLSSNNASWTGAIRTAALIAHILLIIFRNADELSANVVARAQTTHGMRDMLKTIFQKDCTKAEPAFINPELCLSSETVDKIRHYAA